jgi:SAM-dependent methyltransferase
MQTIESKRRLPGGLTLPQFALDRIASAIESGDLRRAIRLVEAELRRMPASTPLRIQLAKLYEAQGDSAGAALALTRALRLSPRHGEAAACLGAILARGRLPGHATLDHAGLANCLAHRNVDRDLVGAAALHALSTEGPLEKSLEGARTRGFYSTARTLLARRAPPLLRDDLFLAILENCTIASRDIELLLAALRRVILLDIPAERLAEAELSRFVAALARQLWSSEYIQAVTCEERAALEAMPPVAIDRLLAGDASAGADHFRRSLYENPVVSLPIDVSELSFSKVRPLALGRLLSDLREESSSITGASASIERLGTISRETSVRVKAQYENSPYPRWRSAAIFHDGPYTTYLEAFFSRQELQFAKRPFEVLIAGCGTGCQAVSAALEYGSTARVLGLDISLASLGYAGAMARRMGADNLSLALGDLGDTGAFQPSWKGRFEVIECCGVLHHMADPFGAWASLLDCLAPGGIMLIGLYSRLARRHLETLRGDPLYPGAGCSDDALRDYREALFSRAADAPGASYLGSRDAFTTSGFRDFFLHVNETPTGIPEISAFLSAHGLRFRGFVNVPFGVLKRRFPGETWPGRLEAWSDLEAEEPDLFIGMYQFWLSRA